MINKERILKMKSYYLKNKEAILAQQKEYVITHRTKIKIKRKIYYDLHKEEQKPKTKEWRKIQRATNPKYMETKRIQIAKRQREMGFKSLNNWFQNSDAHHLDKINVIYIPTKLNESVPHRQSNNEQMKKINIIAWDYMESHCY